MARRRATRMTEDRDAAEAAAINMAFAERCRNIREAFGFSQSQIADAIGITPSMFNQLEHGHHEFTLTRVKRIADAIGVCPTRLMRGIVWRDPLPYRKARQHNNGARK